ncbi:MAG: SDR family oxidoreductase [Thermodesulfobacteriota bacterium]
MRTILITGATGYIGRRLKTGLLEDGRHAIRLLVRNRSKVSAAVRHRLEIVEGDTLKPATLTEALRGIDTAYYLIHSMGAAADFSRLDRQSAENFREACIAAGVRRIVYLGGLGVKGSASRHLLSRIETGEILASRPEAIQTLWFRAGVIIGSGSASFEIIRNLVQKLPIMVTPRWVETRTQPIGVADVIDYLAAALELEEAGDQIIDIGAEAMSFREMLGQAATGMGLTRRIWPVPFLSPRLSSYWLTLFTPVPFRMAAALIEGLKSETVAQNDNARRLFPAIRPRPYQQAVREALREIEENQVLSRWCDSSAGAVCDITEEDAIATAILRDIRTFDYSGISAEKVFASACAIGGEAGWFTYHFLWGARGVIDKLTGGYGLSRGRRHPSELRVGDALDFWKVADIKEGKRLLLLAQMKVPGKAWLEFDLAGHTLTQTAHFYPNGLWGRLYWYAMLPFHHLVFRDLGTKIVRRAAAMP